MTQWESKINIQKLNEQQALRGSNPQHHLGRPPPGQGGRGTAGRDTQHTCVSGEGSPGPAAGFWMSTAHRPLLQDGSRAVVLPPAQSCLMSPGLGWDPQLDLGHLAS